MNDELRNLVGRVRNELLDIERVVQRAQTHWKKFQRTRDDAYLDSVALNLHGFYEGDALITDVTPLFKQIRGELLAFSDFLEQRARAAKE